MQNNIKSEPLKYIKIITLFAILFPYVGFLPGFDVQPFFVPVVLLAITVANVTGSILFNKTAVTFISCGLLLLLFRLLLQYLFSNTTDNTILSFSISVFHLLVILICALVVHNKLVSVKPIYYYIGFSAYILIGFVQLFEPDFLSFLVYRGYQELASTGRGVRSLASEPAVFGNLLSIINILWVFIYTNHNKTPHGMLIVITSLFFLLVNFLLAGSFYSIFYHAIIVALLIYYVKRYIIISISPLIGVLVFEIYYLMQSGKTANIGFDRFYDILLIIVNNPLQLYEQGAFLRVMNVPISIYGGLLHSIIGSGFAPSSMVYGEIVAISGVPYQFSLGDRAAGGVVELFLRLGVLSLPILYWYYTILKTISRYGIIVDNKYVNIGKWAAISLFLLGFTYNSMANPLLWLVTFCYFFNVNDTKKYR